MLYSTQEILKGIREFELENGVSKNYSISELGREIKKERRKMFFSIAGTYIGGGLTAALLYYAFQTDNPTYLISSAATISALIGANMGFGKVSAIRADSFKLAKKDLEKKLSKE